MIIDSHLSTRLGIASPATTSITSKPSAVTKHILSARFCVKQTNTTVSLVCRQKVEDEDE